MGAEHLYGKDIAFDYFPLAGDDEIKLDSLISARLYGPNTPPSDEQLNDVGQASTGHIGSRVGSWDFINPEGTGPAGYRIVFPAIPDPEAGSGRAEYDLFFVALNFRAQADGPELRDDEQITVWRPDGLTVKLRVSAEDVFGLESKIRKLRPITWVESKIELAREELLNRLDARGYPKRKHTDVSKLRLALVLLATSYACKDLGGEENPSWFEKARDWRDQSEQQFSIVRIGIDRSGADRPDPNAKARTGGSVIFIR